MGEPAAERLTALFAEAIALTPDGRAALLDRLRRADAPLADALAGLLAADATADTALATGGLSPAGELPAPRPTALDIPGYRVLGVLGEGGMGTVYAGEQQVPRRRVAIKVLHARSQGALVRFRAEAEIMARLDHPGIARVLEAGDAGGHPFLIMEHVDGETLDRHARAMARPDRLALFAALCDAVHHAHVHGVIHRDLKPANVMVRPDGRVVVLDFGVARLAAGAATGGETRAGELIGTPLYMSPEQARLRADQVDARSDVYTLGVMLYELLSGELPYPVHGLPLPAVAGVICDDEPVPLGKRDASLRGDLEAIADRALRKQATERYQSAAALGDDVQRYLAGRPVSVRTPGTIEQLRRFVRRRPVVAAAIGAALAATAVFAIIVTRLWLAASAARAAAEAARADLEVRTDELTLRQARAALARDPTEAIAWLATLVAPEPAPGAARALDPDAAWGIAEEALGRGVASHVLHGHGDEVHWIEPIPGTGSAPGSADFVTGAYDGRAIVWQAPGYAPREVFRAPRGRIRLVRPSPDGARLAIGSDDGGLHVVATAGGAARALAGHAGDVQHIAWSPDGAWLATGDDRGAIWLWPRGAAPGQPLARSTVAIGTLAFSADGAALVAGDHLGAIWLWRPGPGAAPAPITAHIGDDVVDTWTDGAHVMAVDAGGTVWTWHVDGDALVLDRSVATGLPTKRAVFSTARSAAASGTAASGSATAGAWVVLGGVSGTATLVDGAAAVALATHHAQVRYIAITADGRRVATASDDGVLQVADRATGRHVTLRGHAARIRHLAFAGTVLLSSDGEGVVRRWELDAMPGSVLDGSGAPVVQMAASRDGARLATIDAAGRVVMWTLGDGGRVDLGRIEGHGSAIAVAGRAPVAITGSAEGEVTWWRAPPVRRTLRGIIRAIAAAPDRVAVATSGGPISVFTLDGDPVAELPGNTGGTEALAFDPDGGLLASGGQDRVIRVYRAGRAGDGFAQLAELSGPTGDTHFVAFSPAGDRLLATGNDGVVRSWRVADGRVDPAGAVLAHHTGAASALAVSVDGRWLASAGRDDVVIRRALPDGPEAPLATGGAASALAFDAGGGIQAVTRNGAVVHAVPAAFATVIDHGARAGAAIAANRLAVALDDGAVVIETLGPHTLDQLTAVLARATTLRAPVGR